MLLLFTFEIGNIWVYYVLFGQLARSKNELRLVYKKHVMFRRQFESPINELS